MIRQKEGGVEAMYANDNRVACMQNEMRVQLAMVGGKPRVEVYGSTKDGASVEDIAMLFDDIKSAAISAVLALHPGNGEPEV